jgi:hypothetical protein
MAKVVGITDLEKEFGLQGRTIRQVLRRAGLKAPETGVEGFGPRARYEWTEGSKELKQVRAILEKFVSKEVEDEEED